MYDPESWQFKKSVTECNRFMLEHGIATDVTFRVTSDFFDTRPIHPRSAQTFAVHRYQLVSRSPVFYAMLCGDLAEKGDIVIDDVEPEAFREMLNFIYTDEVHITADIVFPLLYASKKYLLPGLTDLCLSFCESNLFTDNACVVYDQCLLYDEKELAERSLHMIKWCTTECLTATSMLDIRQSTLSKILDSDAFTASEAEIYSACINWAKHQIEQKEEEVTDDTLRIVLGECGDKIRYATMDTQDFGAVVSANQILPQKDQIMVFNYLATKQTDLLPARFSHVNRTMLLPLEVESASDLISVTSFPFTSTFEITSNYDLAIDQLLMADMKKGEYNADYNNCNQMYCAKVNFDGTDVGIEGKTSGSETSWKLKLSKPVYMRKGCTHTLAITLKDLFGDKAPVQIKSGSSMDFIDPATDLTVFVNCTNGYIVLLGFTYMFIY